MKVNSLKLPNLKWDLQQWQNRGTHLFPSWTLSVLPFKAWSSSCYFSPVSVWQLPAARLGCRLWVLTCAQLGWVWTDLFVFLIGAHGQRQTTFSLLTVGTVPVMKYIFNQGCPCTPAYPADDTSSRFFRTSQQMSFSAVLPQQMLFFFPRVPLWTSSVFVLIPPFVWSPSQTIC